MCFRTCKLVVSKGDGPYHYYSNVHLSFAETRAGATFSYCIAGPTLGKITQNNGPGPLGKITQNSGPYHYYSNVRLLPCTEIQAGSRIEAGSRIGKITQWAPCILL